MKDARHILVPVLAVLLLAFGACRAADDAAGNVQEASGDAVAAATGAAEEAPRAPRLREVHVLDSTPVEARPKDVALPVEERLKEALGVFEQAPGEDPGACVAEVAAMYVLTVNEEVAPDAEAGEARMVIEGNLHCPLPDDPHRDAETFRATVESDRAFGPGHDLEAGEALSGLLDDLAPRVAQRVYGQALVRHADDDRILKVLAEEDRPGLLMEAASEAGERKLEAAIPHLVRLTNHEDEVVVLRAGGALGLLEHSEQEVLRALAGMTEGSDVERHLVALNALGDIGGEEAARYLDTIAVGHPMAPIREAAREAARRARGQGDGP
ncbi:MAG: HEAT repeat domain-containing protein [Myxococcota bacterium]